MENSIHEPELPIEVKIFEGSAHALFLVETDWIRNDYLNNKTNF
jgi:hypothetical protein